MENVVRIKLTNAKLNDELQQALAVLATAHDTDKKTVTLHFLGNGKRPVRVGYIQEAPLVADQLSARAQRQAASRSCKAGRSSKIRPSKIGTTCR